MRTYSEGPPAVHRLSRSALGATALTGVAFLVLAAMVAGHHGPLAVDVSLARSVNARTGSSSFKLGELGSFIGDGPVVAASALAVGAYLLYRTREFFLAAAVPAAPAIGGLVELATKHVVKRPHHSTRLKGRSGFGFPSGHTTGYTAMVVALVVVLSVLVFHNRHVIVAAVLAAASTLVLAVSRVLVGAHSATDVIGGLLLGAAVGVAVVHAALLARARALDLHQPVPRCEPGDQRPVLGVDSRGSLR